MRFIMNKCLNSSSEILKCYFQCRLIITEPNTKKVYIDVLTSHKANIFSAKFLPGSDIRKIVSCAGDGNILFTDLSRIAETRLNSFSCHSGTTYELLTVSNDPNSFLSCGEDGTVRWFDLRTKDKCRKSACTDDVLINLPNAVTSMTINPHLPYYLAVGSSDSSVRIFDRRMLGSKPSRCKAGLVSRFLLPDMDGKKRRITAIDYRPDGQEILVSFSSDYIYVFDPNVSSFLIMFCKYGETLTSFIPIRTMTRQEPQNYALVRGPRDVPLSLELEREVLHQ